MPTPAPWRPARDLAMALASTPLALALPASGQEAAPTPLPRVEVVGTTPVPGLNLPRDRVPGHVQTVDDTQLRQSQALHLADHVAERLPGITVNQLQGNPYQLDVNFRGFSASPLLGTPQGLSVFLDGVRINEGFGDIVNWDLIPRSALASLTLMPGSNPLFGLNTLGGALALQTKSGKTHPGTEVELSVGSFGRVNAEVSHGRMLGKTLHLFVAASGLNDEGWRDHSPSKVRQAFVRLGEQDGPLRWDLSGLAGRNTLIGNGATPESMLEADRAQVYTRPDETANRAAMLSFSAGWRLTPEQALSGTAYLRRVRTFTLNGDLNDDYDPPLDDASGVENRTTTRQRSFGLALQWSLQDARHSAAAGIAIDESRSYFQQSEAEGLLDATRAVVPTGDAQVRARIRGHSRTLGLYATDTLALSPQTHLTLSGRYNRTRVRTDDEGRSLLGLDTALDASDTYASFNPAAGLTWKATPTITAYGGLSQGSRAPSPIELGCSDPEQPCVLPNALQADPPLKQVVSRSFELGLRGGGEGLRWNANVYRTVNRDDILFVSNSRAAGYFRNFGRTQRQGLELDLSALSGPLDWTLAYSLLQATYRSPACIVAESNSSAGTFAECGGEGEILVRPGDRIPGLPAHTLKAGLGLRPTEGLRLGAHLVASARQGVRGNENGAHSPDGGAFSGRGHLPGHAVLNLTGEWTYAPGVQFFARVDNVFDRRHATGGLLAENAFDAAGRLQAPDDWRHEQFATPGLPRSAWIGIRLSFDAD